MISRRQFLEGASAAVAQTLVHAGRNNGGFLGPLLSDGRVTSEQLEGWNSFGRTVLQRIAGTVVVQDGYLIHSTAFEDGEFGFASRVSEDVSEVQIWAGIKCRSRDERYVFGLRGGGNNDIYLARHDADGSAKFLGIAPLNFRPEKGVWYKLRAVTRGKRILIFLNDEELPRVNALDEDAEWSSGAPSIGGAWLPAEFKDFTMHALSPEAMVAIDTIGAKVWKQEPVDKVAMRKKQRADFRPLVIEASEEVRAEHSLAGTWLFMPDQELLAEDRPFSENFADEAFHTIDVPNFWTPTLSWLHGEIGFPHLDHISSTKGIADQLFQSELTRLENYTFDWRATKGGWYRQYLEVPTVYPGRRLELVFDAIAKIADVWVNGVHIGSHTGMFACCRFDISRAVRPGMNVIVVHVLGRLNRPGPKDDVRGVAVTVEVTTEMLASIPHGMYPAEASGIWQDVKLVVSDLVRVDDIYIRPKLTGAEFDVQIANLSGSPRQVSLSYSISSRKDGTVLHSSEQADSRTVDGGELYHFATPQLKPELWSPSEPNLYELRITVMADGKLADVKKEVFGFRTFSTKGNRLMLNGRPFWLRGANHFPNALRPNDSGLARTFMRLAKQGNVAVTRSHTVPFSKCWLEAADEIGMAVSFEGTWPWLMLDGDPPSPQLLDIWRNEFLSLIRQFRNHPSLIFWTVNNEMKFEIFDRKNPERLKRKWQILSDVVKAVRQLDPSRPLVCDSSYCRQEAGPEYSEIIAPNGFDDGDIDDAHRYYGWYEPTFYHFFKGEFSKKASYAGRPLISQEMSTGYARNDDGHPVRFYTFQHQTPQALVGDDAYEQRDPGIFLSRQSLMTKELAEAFRRSGRDDCSGILHFSYVSWFKNVWDTRTIEPLKTYHELALALQPVLVSAELYGRHFFAGTKKRIRICVVNDSEDGSALDPMKLTWQIVADQSNLASGEVHLPGLEYYANQWRDLEIEIPNQRGAIRKDARLILTLETDGKLVSRNEYQIVVATREWASGTRLSYAVLSHNGARSESLPGTSRIVQNMAMIQPNEVLVLPRAKEYLASDHGREELIRFVENGGRVLLLHPAEQLSHVFPDHIQTFRECPGEITSMHHQESLVFNELQPLDLAWFEVGPGLVPRACSGVYRIAYGRSDVWPLVNVIDIHGYLHSPSDLSRYAGSALVQLKLGKGIVFATEMMLLEAPEDPIAGRLFSNLIRALDEFK